MIGCSPTVVAPDLCEPSAEVCDGVDNDCDGVADEGIGARYFRDADGDGFGDPAVSVLICAPPPGYVAVASDCDDARASVHPDAIEVCNRLDDDCNGEVDEPSAESPVAYIDADGDGHGDPSTLTALCPGVSGLVEVGDDCDDTNPAISPSAFERCNGVDDNCDGAVDLDPIDSVSRFLDQDDDGYGSTSAPACPDDPAYSDLQGDCDDSDPSISPGAIELPADGLDQDCDGLERCYIDFDLDGSGGVALEFSADIQCAQLGNSPASDDCNDLDPSIGPNAPEVCGNGEDDDCDPLTPDLVDADGDGRFCDLDCDDQALPSAPDPYLKIDGLAGLDLLQGAPPYTCGVEVMAGGAAVADFDGDGATDLFLPRMHLPDKLYRNNGDGTYSDVSSAWGISTEARSSGGAVFFDADGDDDLDLYITTIGLDPNTLYINNGTSFSDESIARGANHSPPIGICQHSFSVSAADADGDGDLDLHLTGWEPLIGVSGNRDQLLINNGGGYFTESPYLDLEGRASFSSAWADFDDDGDLDVAVSSDWGRSSLWRNDGGLSFVDVTMAGGVGGDENGMGNAVADVDGDGRLDWFVTAIFDATLPCPQGWGCSGNRLYLGNGDLSFTDATDSAGVRDAGWAWGAVFFDRDNDGDLDLAVENGFPTPSFEQHATRLFDNDGATAFTEIGCDSGLATRSQGRSIVPFHHDSDGDLDLLVIHAGEPIQLFEATGNESNHWLTIALSQPGRDNTRGIGAQVWMTPTPGAPEVRRDIHLNAQFGATSPPQAHYGLGATLGAVEQVRVIWPDGAEEIYPSLTADQRLTLTRTVP